MDQQKRELYSWDKLIAKATRAEAKAGLQPSSTIHDMDQHCHCENWPVYIKSSHTRDKQPDKAQISPSKAGQTPAHKLFSPWITSRALITLPRPLKKRIKKIKSTIVVKTRPKKKQILTPLLPVLTQWSGPKKTFSEYSIIIAIRRAITPRTMPSQEKTTVQKTSNSLGNLHVGDWN